jgi:hypothetical protein
MSTGHKMPVIPRALVEYAGRSPLQRFLEVIIIEIAHYHSNLVSGAVCHQIGKEANRVTERASGRFEPDNVARYVEQIVGVRKIFHVLRHRLLIRRVRAPAAEAGDVARAGGGGGFDQEAFGIAAVGEPQGADRERRRHRGGEAAEGGGR